MNLPTVPLFVMYGVLAVVFFYLFWYEFLSSRAYQRGFETRLSATEPESNHATSRLSSEPVTLESHIIGFDPVEGKIDYTLYLRSSRIITYASVWVWNFVPGRTIGDFPKSISGWLVQLRDLSSARSENTLIQKLSSWAAFNNSGDNITQQAQSVRCARSNPRLFPFDTYEFSFELDTKTIKNSENVKSDLKEFYQRFREGDKEATKGVAKKILSVASNADVGGTCDVARGLGLQIEKAVRREKGVWGGGNEFIIRLRRSPMLKFFFFLLYGIALLLLVGIHKLTDGPQAGVAILAYIGGLWGIRSFLQSHIRLFPTLVDFVMLVLTSLAGLRLLLVLFG